MLRYRDFPLVAAVCIAIYFIALIAPGLDMHFAPDDMQNTYTYWMPGVWAVIKANLLFATSFYRPLGGLYYLPLYGLFGFNPLPYRIVMFVLLCVNVLVFYAFARAVTNSREIGAFAVLLGCFHAAATGVYVSNAMIYEVFCFLFLIATLLFYVRIRSQGRPVTWRELAVLAVLFACALNSKEMAAAVPAIMVAYELIYFGFRRRSIRELIPIVVTGLMTAIYMAAKLFAPNSLGTIPGYQPAYTLDRFLLTSGTYVADLFLSETPFKPMPTILFWAGLIVVAAVLRRKNMLFGVAFSFLSFLPLNFVPPRQGFVIYIPLVGFAIYVADLIVAALDLIRVPDYRWQASAIAFIACLVVLAWIHGPQAEAQIPSILHSQSITWGVLQEFKRVHPRVERGAKILLVDSPIENDWDIYFIAKLYFRDRTLRASWMRSAKPVAYGDVHENFDHEFRFQGPTLVQTK